MKKLLIAASISAALATAFSSYASEQFITMHTNAQVTHSDTAFDRWVAPSIRYSQQKPNRSAKSKLAESKHQSSTFTTIQTTGEVHYSDPLWQIADPNLRTCIESYAIQNGYQWVSDIVEVQCFGQFITSLAGIQNFTAVNRLVITDSQIADLTPIVGMPQLKHVDFWGNSIVDLSQISAMTQIETLIIGGNPITDLTALSQFTALKELALPDANLANLNVINGLTQLEFLDIGQNPIQDYSALNGLPLLKAVHLDVPSASIDIASMLLVHREWEWLGVNQHQSFCWQLDYIEKYHTFAANSHWTRPMSCDSANDWEDYDGDGLANIDEVQTDTDPLLFDTDNDGTPDGQLPGGDSHIWDAVYGLVDPSLQQCVNDVINANPAIQFASEITALDCQSRSIHNLQGIEAFIKLSDLNLSNNMTLTNIQLLGQLGELVKLEAYSAGISDISWVSSLPKLKELWLGSNPVTDVTPLQNLTQLTALGLPEAGLTDLSAIANLTGLEFLDMGLNPMTDISAASNFTHLKMFDVSQNGIKDIAPILRAGTQWEWLGVSTNVYCWQLDYVEEYNTFTPHGWYRPYSCDNSDDWNDRDGDGLANLEELHGDTSPVLFDTDNDGAPDGQLPGGDRYIWDAIHLVTDYQLNMCLQNVINADTSIQYASQITKLDCQSRSITSLEGLSAFIALEELEMSNNNISDLAPVTQMPALTSLFLFNNQVTDVSALAGFTQLKVIMLGGNSVSDITPLSQLTGLESLVLPNGNITDLSPIAALTNLQFLDTEANPISDLSVLSQLPQIHTLGVGSLVGSDISPILLQARHWQWLGLNNNAYCWQIDYLEKYHTFEQHAWYRPMSCDSSTDYQDFDGDGIANKDELMAGDTNPLLLDTDNDGTPDGQLPGGDSYIWDAYYQLPDTHLQSCVQEQMSAHPEWEFASQLTELNCMSRNISQLTGIDKFIGLTTLEVSSNNISDLSPVFGLANLKSLMAMGNPITSLAGIEAMSSLEVLILFDVAITDISPIFSLTQLRDLALPTTGFTDMSLLNGLTNLQFLDIANNPVSDLTGFNHYHQLKFIGLDSTQVKDITALFNHSAMWEWVGLPTTAYCWQSKYIEKYHNFEFQWYPNASCDNTQDYQDYDADGIDNWSELNSLNTDPTIANAI